MGIVVRSRIVKRYKKYYIISTITLFLTFFLGTAYRLYIYKNMLNDYGLADVHPNICAVIVAAFLFMGWAKYKTYREELKVIICVTLGFIIYELIQPVTGTGIYDWKDVIGTLIGAFITLVIHKLIVKIEGI